MSLFDILTEDRSCGWRSPGLAWACTLDFDHRGRCQLLDPQGVVFATWPGPGCRGVRA